MPDDPGPVLRAWRRPWWAAPSAVLGVTLVVALAIWVSEARGGSAPTVSQLVITAPTSVASIDTGATPRSPQLGPEMQPAAGTRDRRCGLTRTRIIRVMQFNIHSGIDRSGRIDLPTIAAEIEHVHPDVVSLNEVDSGTLRTGHIDETEYLARATGMHAVYGPNLPWQGGRFGNAILTRFPVVGTLNLGLPVVSGLEPRGMLMATLHVGRRTVWFASTHLSDGSDGRASRILQARAVATVLRRSTQPMILAGDLNARPGSRPVRTMRHYLLDAQELGGVGPGATFPESTPDSRIDYVLYDRHLTVASASTHVLPSTSSDHRAVFSELALLPRRCGPAVGRGGRRHGATPSCARPSGTMAACLVAPPSCSSPSGSRGASPTC